MALVAKQETRIEHPTEPGTWAVIRVPVSVGDLEGSTATGRIGSAIDVVAACLQSWSYDDPPSRANVARLDLASFRWLEEAINAASGIREEAEKNASGSSSPATTERVAEPSLVSSGI